MIEISTAEIERQIARYELRFDSLKDDEIEWRYQPPAFVVAFAQFVEQFHRVPAPEEYASHYIEKNRDALRERFDAWRDAPTRNWKKRALMARLKRAYPSFVRDFYFCALLREHGVAAEYDAAQDVEGGVDLIVSSQGRVLQVHVFLDSPRAKQGRAKKERRHAFTGEHLDVILHPDECKHVGAFWLPTLAHVQQVKRAIGH
jgi:predicted nucleic acid-binding protein